MGQESKKLLTITLTREQLKSLRNAIDAWLDGEMEWRYKTIQSHHGAWHSDKDIDVRWLVAHFHELVWRRKPKPLRFWGVVFLEDGVERAMYCNSKEHAEKQDFDGIVRVAEFQEIVK